MILHCVRVEIDDLGWADHLSHAYQAKVRKWSLFSGPQNLAEETELPRPPLCLYLNNLFK
jgi:hypothetical protein